MNEKILIADDEPDVCEMLREALAYEGFRVTVAGSGREALTYLKQTRYQLAAIDIRLEGAMSGVNVIKDCGVLPVKPKILVISATPHRLLKPVFEKAGVTHLIDRVLEKPSDLNPDRFVDIVKGILQE